MKIEKAPKEKTARDIEMEHEKSQDWVELDDDSKLTLEELKTLIAQGVAKLEFKEDVYGTVESVIIKRTLDDSVVFYSENPRDIEEILK